MSRRGATLAGHGPCTPEAVGAKLGQTLAVLLCRERHGPRGPAPACADCGAAGRVLAKPVARALLFCRRTRGDGTDGTRPPQPLSSADYEVVGRSLELLEVLAGLRQAASG